MTEQEQETTHETPQEETKPTLSRFEAFLLYDELTAVTSPQLNGRIPKEKKDAGDYGIGEISGKASYAFERSKSQLFFPYKKLISDENGLWDKYNASKEVSDYQELAKVQLPEDADAKTKSDHEAALEAAQKLMNESYKATQAKVSALREEVLNDVSLYKCKVEEFEKINYNPAYYPNMGLIIKWCVED